MRRDFDIAGNLLSYSGLHQEKDVPYISGSAYKKPESIINEIVQHPGRTPRQCSPHPCVHKGLIELVNSL